MPRWLSRMLVNSIAMIVFLSLVPGAANANEFTPVGLWKTVDDSTGKPRGLVRLTRVNGAYQGKIERIFPKPGEVKNPRCDKCEGARQGQPIVGMTILWGLTKQGEEYEGGEILDPESGRIYRVKMTIADEGQKLLVRGFIGFSLLGRTQVWLRQE